jgi:hypothetical protein
MPRKRTSDTTAPATDVAAIEKPKRARALSTTPPRRTTRRPAEAAAAAASISNLADAVASNGGSPAGPDPGEVAQLAYAYWEARGGQGGSSEQDWHRAEQELRVRCAVAAGG